MRLLLHICCGPCSLFPISQLLKEEFEEVVGFFYNPNIHPYSEYIRRRQALQEAFRNDSLLKIFFPDYDMKEFFRKIGDNYSKPGRCQLCWTLRLERTATFAKENNFSAFTTTLLISPYQDHESLKDIGKKIAKEKGLEFYYEDFRPGFRESQNRAKEKQLYRQKYCGCVFSELERTDAII